MDTSKAKAQGASGLVDSNTLLWEKYLLAMNKFKENQNAPGYTPGSLHTSAVAENPAEAAASTQSAGASRGVSKNNGNEVNVGGSSSADKNTLGVAQGLNGVNYENPSSTIDKADKEDIDVNFETSQSSECNTFNVNNADFNVKPETPSFTGGDDLDAAKSDIVIRFSNNSDSESETEEGPSSVVEEVKVPLAVTHYQSTASPNANSSRDQHALSYSEPTGPKTSPRTSGISALKGENFLPLNLESTGSEGQEQEKPESEQPAINPDDTSPEDLDIESDHSDEVTYHPDRFDMARRPKTGRNVKNPVAPAPPGANYLSNGVDGTPGAANGAGTANTRNTANATVAAANAANASRAANNPGYPVASQETKDELKMLQEQMMTKFGFRNRGLIILDPDYVDENLALARKGDGTDPTSKIAKKFASRLVTDSSTFPRLIENRPALPESGTPASMQLTRITNGPKNSRPMQHDGDAWIRYLDDLPVYNEPDADYNFMWNSRLHAPISAYNGREFSTKCRIRDESGQPTRWENTFGSPNPDWLYPTLFENQLPAFILQFRAWLSSAAGVPDNLITNRRSFFDGTAHCDGINSFFIPEVDELVTFLDHSDKHNAAHAHETSAGYMHNYMTRIAKEKAEEAQRKLMAKLEYREMMKKLDEQKPNPNVPKASIYLRPVENHDIHELTNIYNWYIRNTVRCLELQEITEQEMINRKDEILRERLPFIVAIERKPNNIGRMVEAVVGFASATDFTGPNTASRHTAELELFAHPQKLRLGIGKCLIDKLLEATDRAYVAKSGYFFDAKLVVRPTYFNGGSRPLARLIFLIHFPVKEDAEYLWIKDWLEKNFMFEEQAMLKGTGFKQDKILNSSYMVRNTGYVIENSTRG